MRRRTAFNMLADMRYNARKAAVWTSLKCGETIIADIDGARQEATVLEHLGPEIRVRTEDGAEHIVRQQAFHGIRRKM